ncbi:VrrA/YqfQ family protein [Bacillus sp. LL01]|uniref:VrrA/YqfQ family protein n=1 Tax=Bacillus sp. LL01 TaxID=1665556 RepID=UPI00069E507E|nr:VrrA/YqfQ family protein [Bacillus sp. LL01]
MFFGPNRSMSPMHQPMRQSPFHMGPSPFRQQPPNNMFNMFNMPNPNMRNMSNMPNSMMMRNPSPFMGGAGRGIGMGMGGNNGGGGGLLARLLGRTGARGIGNMGGGLGQMAANTGARGGLGQLANAGTLQQLINPNNLTGMLGNVQKALKMAEGVMPMVQQYGPLVRNVPAMIKLYSELKNVDDTDDDTQDTSTEETTDEGTEVKVSKVSNDLGEDVIKIKKMGKKPKAETAEVEEKPKGSSAPKLYI